MKRQEFLLNSSMGVFLLLTATVAFVILVSMLVIKLKRIGKKHQAAFRLIVDEKRHQLFGKNVEDLGWYNPRQDKFEVKKDRILYWLKTGAKTTDTVHNLLVSAGVLTGKKIAVHKKPKVKKDGEFAKPSAAGAAIVPAPVKMAVTSENKPVS